MKKTLLLLFYVVTTCFVQAQYVSKVWVADQGNGIYKNPVLFADYSDPDVCRVGDDYYLTSSSFNCIPGLQILHSNDLVNWTIIGAAVPYALPPVTDVRPEHGNRVWAPCIRHHNNEFYIFWGDPDQGAFMVKAKKPEGPWSEPVLVKPGKGIIDTSPLWDDDGRVYLVHAYAGSRSGLKSVLAVCELNTAADSAITPSRIIFDGHENQETSEGPKFYKRNGYYYIFHPAGGVATGWQTVQRSKNVYGPYETRVVMTQGKTFVNGPHQGAWVTTPLGEDWFLHFQDVGAYGRLVHLQPMKWVEDWPVIGEDLDGDGCGEPVLTYKKPKTMKKYPICTPQESDDFDSLVLGPQWQWQANFNEKWLYCAGDKSFLRLYSFPVNENTHNLWEVSNLLLQKIPAPELTVTTKVTFSPSTKYEGERAGLVIMGMDYAAVLVENTPQGFRLSQVECIDANKGAMESVHEELNITSDIFYFQAKIDTVSPKSDLEKKSTEQIAECSFFYSIDGKKYKKLGKKFQLRKGQWIGAKMGIFCTRPFIRSNDGGWADFHCFKVEK
ncbi:glycoside hydrolase 43 family protein [Phocaeicola vulgatus]|nr:glycoside hydrolase 43 family protein [Phocaeicola vulgatus]